MHVRTVMVHVGHAPTVISKSWLVCNFCGMLTMPKIHWLTILTVHSYQVGNLGYNCAAAMVYRTVWAASQLHFANHDDKQSCLKLYISTQVLYQIFPPGNMRLRTQVFNLPHCKPVLIFLQLIYRIQINAIEWHSITTCRSIVESVEDDCREPKQISNAQMQRARWGAYSSVPSWCHKWCSRC